MKSDPEEAAIIRLIPAEAWQDKILATALELVQPDGTKKLIPFEPQPRLTGPQPSLTRLTPELVRNTLGETVDPYYGPPGGN
jgi:hypothetical protein